MKRIDIKLDLKDSNKLAGKLNGLDMPTIQRYRTEEGKEFNVVRDDLPFIFPKPNFSKVRGLVPYFERLQEEGVKTVISQDTIIARVGWAVGYFAEQFDMKHYGFYPTGHDDFYRKMMKSFGSTGVELRGNHQRIVQDQAKDWLRKKGVDNYTYLPIGLRMEESKSEHVKLVEAISDKLDSNGTLVMIVSSGTILSGLLAGIMNDNISIDVKGVLIHHFKQRHSKILTDARKVSSNIPLLASNRKWTFDIVSAGYDYNDKALLRPSFPCDQFIDAKAFSWMIDNLDKLEPPVYFWNVGGEWSPQTGIEEGLMGDGQTTKEEIRKYLKSKGVSI
jgi:1-aminocyclopropane-1-carboxylate deaminase/D-cysteine desulfhydrase-like pyridoxal-dependent ACC family enzyme